MKRSVLSLPALALFALTGLSSHVDAVEIVDPAPEEKMRCNALADEEDRTFCIQGYSVRGLKFPDEAQGLGFFTSTNKMAVYKPEGKGPFPAVILLHTCGAIDHEHMRYWVKQTLENGYVAFVVDSWGQRGSLGGVCTWPVSAEFNPIAVRSRDAYDALHRLSKFEFVDPSRIGVMGFSQGGRVAYLLASKSVSEMFSPGKKRFSAAVAVYGECFFRPLGQSKIRPDIDVPLLALLGELDDDGDPKECLPRLQTVKDKGAPVEWHVFPGTGHAWDMPKFSQPQRRHYTGTPSGGVLFAYDGKVTAESRDRAFAFLARHLKRK
jgi:dienelactone hydrolase